MPHLSDIELIDLAMRMLNIATLQYHRPLWLPQSELEQDKRRFRKVKSTRLTAVLIEAVGRHRECPRPINMRLYIQSDPEKDIRP